MGNQRIYKYKLHPYIQTVMPKGAEILSVGAQGEDIVAWALVGPDRHDEWRDLLVVPTGADCAEPLNKDEFVGTVQMDNGLVFHIFDRGPGRG